MVASRVLSRRAGVSALEVLVALVFVGLVAAKAVVLFNATARTSGEEAADITLEDQARVTLDRIAYAVMGSDRGSLDPNLETPAFSQGIRYRVSLGIQDGEVVWDDPEEISVPEATTDLVWAENPGEANERTVLWSRLVAPLLEGELPNGIDDNGNGFIDESGLTFVIDGNSVEITLTLQRQGDSGVPSAPRTVRTMITCRHPL